MPPTLTRAHQGQKTSAKVSKCFIKLRNVAAQEIIFYLYFYCKMLKMSN